MPTIAEKRAVFRELHATGFFIMPNAWDRGSAVRLASLGFRAIASTSAGAAWTAGKDDGGLSRDEVLAHLRLLVDATDLPQTRTSKTASRTIRPSWRKASRWRSTRGWLRCRSRIGRAARCTR